MRIGFRGELKDERRVRAGFIGCGSHSFRNIYPTFQFAPVELLAVCDLSLDKARAFAAQFGAREADYDDRGRPKYPAIAADCLRAGKHVWMEKPPAASCREVEQVQAVAEAAGKNAMVGFKKMFFPANEKAKALMSEASFGHAQLVTLQYPQYVPTTEELERYLGGEPVRQAVGFLDHLCHPVSLMLFLLGMPQTLCYQRSDSGAGAAR